jgi:hypothetical protein
MEECHGHDIQRNKEDMFRRTLPFFRFMMAVTL